MAIPAQQPVADRARAMPHFIKTAETGVAVSYAGSPTPAAGDECQKKIVEIYTRYAKG
jgi:hypothetical protein